MIKIVPLAGAFGLILSQAAFAVGGFDDDTPTSTETTTTCAEGMVWDANAQGCVAIQESRLDADTLIRTARELAYADRVGDAITLLEMAADPQDSMVLTYLGFAHRSAGRMDTGLDYYDEALAADPDNILARAYMGMAYVQLGQPQLAQEQLKQIRARGGVGTWPEEALSRAITAGDTSGYDY